MRGPEYRLPSDHREFLCHPAPGAIRQVLERNEREAAGWEFPVAGMRAGELRRRTKIRLLELARTSNARLFPEDPDGDQPYRMGGAGGQGSMPGSVMRVVLTGHQPVLCHPGVWVKNFLTEFLGAQLGAVPVNLVVDSDTAREVAAHVPVRADGGLARVKETLVQIPPKVPYEGVPPPTIAELEEFARRVREHLRKLGEDQEDPRTRRFEQFLQCARNALPGSTNLSEFVTGARHRNEKASGAGEYLEIPVSRLSRTDEYMRFFAAVVIRARRFARVHNQALAEYRRERRHRSGANPFPDLKLEETAVELPFWSVTSSGRRFPLFLETPGREAADLFEADEEPRDADGHASVGSRVSGNAGVPAKDPPSRETTPVAILKAGGETLVRVPLDGSWIDHLGPVWVGLGVRPRALTLTMFARLFCGELFVHGVGGGKYDRVTDAIIARFFGIHPPGYVVASLGLHLEGGGGLAGWDEAEGWRIHESRRRLEELRTALRALRYNPERLARRIREPGDPLSRGQDTELAPEVEELVRRKEELVRRISTASSGKRPLTREIEAVNEELSRRLGHVGARLASELREAGARARDLEVLSHREYPFFFYAPQAVKGVVAGAFGETVCCGEESVCCRTVV
ncbi:MAG: hypothetical protein HYY08_02860 [Firmicutes bacterium]|nr:hypothetical protein [Bacillota bacterium]